MQKTIVQRRMMWDEDEDSVLGNVDYPSKKVLEGEGESEIEVREGV